MKGVVTRWAVNFVAVFLAVFVAAYLMPEQVLFSGDWVGLAIFAAVLGLLNAFVKPIIKFMTLPISCLTLGLFTLVINGFLFWLATWLAPGVDVAGYFAAFLAALILSIVSFVLWQLAK